MLLAAMLAATLAGFNDYPAFIAPDSRIEAVLDHGPISELIIKCGRGTAILSYSKVDRAYCTPKLYCSRDLSEAVQRTCG